MRKKLIFILTVLVTVPIVVLYIISAQLFENSTRDHLKILNQRNIIGVKQSLMNFFDEPVEISMYPIGETNLHRFFTATGSEADYGQIYNSAYSILTTMPFAMRGSVMGLELLTAAGNQLRNDYFANSITQQDMQAADAAAGYQVWGYGNDEFGMRIITLCREIKNYPDMKKLGYIKVYMSADSLSNVLNSSDDISGVVYYLVDSKNNIVYQSGKNDRYRALYRYFNAASLGGGSASQMVSAAGGPYFISGAAVDRTPFTIYSVAAEEGSFGSRPAILNVLGLTAVVLLFACFALGLIFSKIIVGPLQEMAHKIRSVSHGDFSVRITTQSRDEVGALADQFNRMAEELQHLYNEVYKGRIRQKQAELAALVAQINPHFLHNTLDTIYWMSEMGDTKSVSAMVSSLSSIMRFTLAENSEGVTTLSSELEYLRSYIYIQQVRYSDSIRFDITAEPGLEGCQVLKLILQPLVENAISHGLAPAGGGNLRVAVSSSGGNLIYEVRNNGLPIDVGETRALLDSAKEGTRGFALRNIQDRITLKYGAEYGLTFRLEDGETVFTATQPLVRPPEA